MGNQSPGLIATYGPMGSGKSSDLVATCLGDGCFLGRKNGLQVGTTSFGIPVGLVESKTIEITRMEQVVEGIRWAKKNGYKSCGIDDGSLLMKNTFMAVRESHRIYKNDAPTDNFGMAMYGDLDKVIYDVSEAAADCDIRVYMNFHEIDPSMDKKTGTWYPGGPNLSWKKLTSRIGYHFDLVQRTRKDSGRPRWDGLMECDERNARYVQKNRILDTLTEAPLNTAEMLRASGRTVKRFQSLEWMDGVAEELALAILSGTPEKQARAPFVEKLSAQYPPKLVRWALRDGTHRARIRRATEAAAILGSM